MLCGTTFRKMHYYRLFILSWSEIPSRKMSIWTGSSSSALYLPFPPSPFPPLAGALCNLPSIPPSLNVGESTLLQWVVLLLVSYLVFLASITVKLRLKLMLRVMAF